MSKLGPVVGSIVVEVHDDGALQIKSDGTIKPNDLVIAAWYLNRTAAQLLDAEAFRAAQAADPEGIAVVRAMPDALRNGKAVS